MKNKIPGTERDNLLKTLKIRFGKNIHRHKGVNWSQVEIRLLKQPDKLWSFNEMEMTGGEPDVIGYVKHKDVFIFCDCSPESPKGRRSVCYDHKALESRKKYQSKNSAVNMAAEMGIELLDENQYNLLQSFENFDSKTSS